MPIEPNFVQSTVLGIPADAWTSLQFGSDGRLYASKAAGTIHAFTIEATPDGYAATAEQVITAITTITNHDDDGAIAEAGFQGVRQVTGLLVAPAAPGAPVTLYVGSSDPRAGGGPGGGDTNLDTNSGVISRLTQQADGSFQRVDLVRGLPRSEELHSVNGMQLSADGTKLYVTVGGNTNQGAPSNNFAYTPEYALSAAILEIDLAAIEALPTLVDPKDGSLYKYDLPTLGGNPADPFPDDPFGGFDGLNQAVLVPGGPVRIFSPGYRNPYDIVLTQSGLLYTIDNGGNAGWGGVPVGEGPATGGTSGVTNAPVDGGPETPDHLHLVTEGFYGGFPNPIRANPDGAGWYIDGSTTPIPPSELPPGWPPVPVANPVEGDFLAPGSDGSLHTWLTSTNGLAEYLSSATFEGAMAGDLLAVSWDDHLYRIELSPDGSSVVAVTQLTAGLGVAGGGLPLDVTSPGDGSPFAGTIWVANLGGGITVLTPSDAPPGQPGDDADGDGLVDSIDPFAEDPANGRATDLAAGQVLVWNFSQSSDPPGPNALFNMGFTGLMSNGLLSYRALYDAANIKAGGAAAGFQVEQVPGGDAIVNTQQNGFQFGLDVRPEVGSFTIEVKIDNPFGGPNSTTPANWKSQGFYIGTGDQDNYLKIVAAANGGAGGIEVAWENDGDFLGAMYGADIAGPGIQALDSITLRLTVDAGSGLAAPGWSYTVGGVAFAGTGEAVQISGATLQALQGSYTVGGQASGLAVGIIATSYGASEAFPAFWESIRITADGGTAAPGLAVTQSGGATALAEGGAGDSITLALTRQPTANVVVTITGGSDLTLAAGGAAPAAGVTLLFTPETWNEPQSVSIAAVDDALPEGVEIANLAFALASADPAFDGLSVPPVAVSITDNDTPPQDDDADDDGLLDTVDRFALDATNGFGASLAARGAITLDFASGVTPFDAGFTGVLANGTAAHTALAGGGSIAGGKLLVQAGNGDPYGGLNTQLAAYQFGVDTTGVQAFTISSRIDNPFAGGTAPQNWRGAGLQFGAGDQDNYAKLTFAANGGAGGIEFLVETAGDPDGATYGLGAALGSIAYAELHVDIVQTATGATATPRWTLHDAAGAEIGAGAGFTAALAGAMLDAVQGDLLVDGQQSGLAVGVIATSYGSDAPFQAAWDSIAIRVTGAGDLDGDGLPDAVDRFALDALNGGGNNLAALGSLTLDFSSGATPFAAGFTGVLSNGVQTQAALATSGSVAGGRLVVQAEAGDPYGGLNTQLSAYQLGVDTGGVQAFTISSRVENPFAGGVAPANWRSAGMQFGAGDQDNYAKLTFSANGGAGGIEFLVEDGGDPGGATYGLGVALAGIAYAELHVDVVKTATGATATPRWTLHDAAGAEIGAGAGFTAALSGALLDAVQGDLVIDGQQSELAIGVIATSYGSDAPFQAAWDSLAIRVAPGADLLG